MLMKNQMHLVVQKIKLFCKKWKWWLLTGLAVVAAGIAAVMIPAKGDTPTRALGKNILAYIKAFSNDPKSYEPIQTEIIDTLFFNESFDRGIKFQRDRLGRLEASQERDSADLASYTKNGDKVLDDYVRPAYNARALDITQMKAIISEMEAKKDSVSKSKNRSPVICYTAKHRCRLKNGMGALVLYQYYVQANGEMEILKFEDKVDGLYSDEALIGGVRPIKIHESKK